MKKYVLLLTLCVVSICSSQEQPATFKLSKGSWLLGGQINYINQNSGSGSNNPLGVYPQIGHAIATNLVVGTYLGYFKDSSDKGIGLWPFVAKYYTVTKKLLFNLEGRAGYTIAKSRDSNFKSKTNEFSLFIIPGLTYRVHKKLAFTLNLGNVGYSKRTFKTQSDSMVLEDRRQYDNFVFNFRTANLGVGFVYLLN